MASLTDISTMKPLYSNIQPFTPVKWGLENKCRRFPARLIFFLAVVMLSIGHTAFAVIPEFTPFDAAFLKRHRFPMRTIGTFTWEKMPSFLPFGTDGTVVKATPDGAMLLSGRGDNGISWNATIGGGLCVAPDVCISTADLDNNGRNDAIIAVHYCGCYPDPGMEYFLLLFDKQGIPTPFSFVGWYRDGADPNLDFVDVDEDGHAELFDQDIIDQTAWLSMYRADKARWKRVSTLSRDTAHPRIAGKIIPLTKPGYQDLETDRFRNVGKLTKTTKDKACGTETIMHLEPGSGQKKTIRFFGDSHFCTLILSTPNERRILFCNTPEKRVSGFFNEMLTISHTLFVTGDIRLRFDESSDNGPVPLIAWFTSGNSSDSKDLLRKSR